MPSMVKIARPAGRLFPTAPREADDVEVPLVLVAFEHWTLDGI